MPYPGSPIQRPARAFTLIELLVVITIIVVLLALLTPALDKAIYAAEMTACGAGVRSIATGAISYAMDHKRAYPNRIGESAGGQPVDLQRSGLSDVPRLKGYLALGPRGNLNCPLNGEVDVEGSDDDTWILAPYAMYFGWRFYKDGQALGGMTRVGGALRWNTDRFTVLAADDSLVIRSDNWGHGTHPDADGKWAKLVMQDEAIAVPQAVSGPAGLKVTLARYSGPPANRGPVDLNFALQDGSVERLDKIGYLAGQPDDPVQDERIVAVPYASTSNENAAYYRQLPPR